MPIPSLPPFPSLTSYLSPSFLPLNETSLLFPSLSPSPLSPFSLTIHIPPPLSFLFLLSVIPLYTNSTTHTLSPSLHFTSLPFTLLPPLPRSLTHPLITSPSPHHLSHLTFTFTCNSSTFVLKHHHHCQHLS